MTATPPRPTEEELLNHLSAYADMSERLLAAIEGGAEPETTAAIIDERQKEIAAIDSLMEGLEESSITSVLDRLGEKLKNLVDVDKRCLTLFAADKEAMSGRLGEISKGRMALSAYGSKKEGKGGARFMDRKG